MVWPEPPAPVAAPNADLPEDIKADYMEAASVLERSPRAAAALLRLAVQKLCIFLGEPGKKINDDIASLVAKGLPIAIGQALDVVRITGNSAVHPGELQVGDDVEMASTLFRLLNLIAANRITEPKHVQEAYDQMPKHLREAVDKRNEKAKAKT